MGRPLSVPKPLPDVERLNELLLYCPESGNLTWKDRLATSFHDIPLESAYKAAKHWASRFSGKQAGSRRKDGYVMICIDGVNHMAHRIVWKITNGHDPVYIDHIDGDKGNNRITNIRDVSHVVNMKNKSLYKSNKSGVPGVEFHKRDCVWVAKIGVDGSQVQLGAFETASEAIAARIAGEVMLNYHQNHGRSTVLKEN